MTSDTEDLTAVGREAAENGERSYWEASAAPGPSRPQLLNDLEVEVLIIGGGFTGLSTAYHLGQRGIECAILEGRRVGFGASGRNGGGVSPRVRMPLSAIAARYGMDQARTVYRAGADAVDTVAEMVHEMSISCSFVRNGAISVAHTAPSLARLVKGARWLSTNLGERSSRELSAQEVKQLTGSPMFVGGLEIKNGGTIHPLQFVRGIAAHLDSSAVPIFENSPVIKLRRDGAKVEVTTEQARVRARRVVIATNAYTNQTNFAPQLYASIIPFQSALIATERLKQAQIRGILPAGRMLADARRVLRYARVLDDRIIFGARGAFGDQASPRTFSRLRKEMEQMFPATVGCRVEFQWSGKVDMTPEQLPQLGQLNDLVLYAMAYNGTGVAMSNFMGKQLAKVISGQHVDLGILRRDLRPIPFSALRTPAAHMAVGAMLLMDMFD